MPSQRVFVDGEFVVHPLFVVPGLVCGLQAHGGRGNVEGTVTHDEPLVLRVWYFTNPQHSGDLLPWCPAVRCGAGHPHHLREVRVRLLC